MSEHTHKSSGNPQPAENSLMIRRCGRCNTLFAPLTAQCSSCRSWDLEWTPASGLGSIVSWRLVHRSVSGAHTEVVPLTIAIVELDEGPWVYTTIGGDLPPFSARPIQVRFQPRPRVDRFPVFAICPAAPGSDDDVLSTSRPRSAWNDVRAPRLDAAQRYDPSWVRTSLRKCDLLEGAKSLDTAAKSVIGFAIRWAPFGGATAGELLVTFGVTRRRFLHMVDEALGPRRTDSVRMRRLKRHLQESLTQAWRMSPTALSAGIT